MRIKRGEDIVTNDTIKRGLRKALKEIEIDVESVQFLNVKKNGNHVVNLGNILLVLNNVDGIMINTLKNTVEKYLNNIDISYTGMLLDV